MFAKGAFCGLWWGGAAIFPHYIIAFLSILRLTRFAKGVIINGEKCSKNLLFI